ncbi:hypothetical protein HK096_006604, partial [Nowakowskiella sp. JEL0078]
MSQKMSLLLTLEGGENSIPKTSPKKVAVHSEYNNAGKLTYAELRPDCFVDTSNIFNAKRIQTSNYTVLRKTMSNASLRGNVGTKKGYPPGDFSQIGISGSLFSRTGTSNGNLISNSKSVSDEFGAELTNSQGSIDDRMILNALRDDNGVLMHVRNLRRTEHKRFFTDPGNKKSTSFSVLNGNYSIPQGQKISKSKSQQNLILKKATTIETSISRQSSSSNFSIPILPPIPTVKPNSENLTDNYQKENENFDQGQSRRLTLTSRDLKNKMLDYAENNRQDLYRRRNNSGLMKERPAWKVGSMDPEKLEIFLKARERAKQISNQARSKKGEEIDEGSNENNDFNDNEIQEYKNEEFEEKMAKIVEKLDKSVSSNQKKQFKNQKAEIPIPMSVHSPHIAPLKSVSSSFNLVPCETLPPILTFVKKTITSELEILKSPINIENSIPLIESSEIPSSWRLRKWSTQEDDNVLADLIKGSGKYESKGKDKGRSLNKTFLD